MITWYVRPDTSHSGTRNGTSYDTAWGGPSEVVWGASGVAGGDTLYVCGTFTLASNWAVGAHGGSSDATRCVIRGDYPGDPGVVTSTAAGGFYFNNGARQWTDIVALEFIADGGRALNIGNGAHNTRVMQCSLTGDGSGGMIQLPVANGNSITDILIEDCDFYGSCSSVGVIAQFVTASGATVTTSRITIRGNRFHACQSPRSIIHFRADTLVTSRPLTDIVIEDNEFEGCNGIPIELNSAFNTYGANTGVKVRRNRMTGCGFATGSTILGGNVIRGFAPSSTADFGGNEITGNVLTNVTGQYGGFNLFFGQYLVRNNVMDGIYTETIDGNGVLLDHGNQNCAVERNTFKNIAGVTGVNNSGAAVMILDSTDCKVRANYGLNNAVGIYIGAEAHPGTGNVPNQSVEADNNTMLDCQVFGFRLQVDAATDNPARNNVMTGPGLSVSSGVTWTGESYNVFFGMGAASGHTLDGTSSTADPMVNALGVPSPGSPLLADGLDLGPLRDIRGYQGRKFIGAYGPARLLRV